MILSVSYIARYVTFIDTAWSQSKTQVIIQMLKHQNNSFPLENKMIISANTSLRIYHLFLERFTIYKWNNKCVYIIQAKKSNFSQILTQWTSQELLMFYSFINDFSIWLPDQYNVFRNMLTSIWTSNLHWSLLLGRSIDYQKNK